MLEVFDRPDGIGSCARRNRSTTAPQALILMNNSFMQVQSGAFAKRVRELAGDDAGKQIDRAYLLALARPPSATERATALKFLAPGGDALVDFCHALLNINEFVYVP